MSQAAVGSHHRSRSPAHRASDGLHIGLTLTSDTTISPTPRTTRLSRRSSPSTNVEWASKYWLSMCSKQPLTPTSSSTIRDRDGNDSSPTRCQMMMLKYGQYANSSLMDQHLRKASLNLFRSDLLSVEIRE